MNNRKLSTWILAGAAGLLALLPACSSSSESVTGTPISGTVPSAVTPLLPSLFSLFQNPNMSPNPGSNIHNDSYLSDSYAFPGPVATSSQTRFEQVSTLSFVDPYTGQPRTFEIGECAGQAYDAQGNIQTVGAGRAGINATSVQRDVITLDKDNLQVLAFFPFTKELPNGNSLTDFGGAGYFYQDNRFRMVVAMPDGHILVLQRQDSPLSDVDQYVAVQDYNVCGAGGAVQTPSGLTSLTLYALMPDKAGNIWFTIGEGIVGTVTPQGQIRAYDLNTATGSGARIAQPDGSFETIANSHAVDEGDSAGQPSGVYVVSTYNMYRFSAGPDGAPQLVWKAPYDHGVEQKPGQVSFGSGTSPTVFNQNGRRFVTIADNAPQMNINVYRAEATLQAGEQRLAAQVRPFGDRLRVSDENSLIVAPAPEGGTSIYAENNWGYLGPQSTLGPRTTEPGFARTLFSQAGQLSVVAVNNEVTVPTIVSKISVPGNTVYTWEHLSTGWHLTALDARDLSIRFRQFASTEVAFNNHYSALSLDPDGRTIFLGTVTGLTKATVLP